MSGALRDGLKVLQQQRVEACRGFQHEEVTGVIQYIEMEIRQRAADARGIGRQQVGVDRIHRHVDGRQQAGKILREE